MAALDGAHDGVHVGRGEQPEAQAQKEKAAEDEGKRRGRAEEDEQGQAEAREAHPEGGQNERLDAVRKPAGERRAGGHDHRLGDEDEAGLLGRQALDVLKIEADEETDRGRGAVVDEGGQIGISEDPVAPEEAQVEDGRGDAALDEDEPGERGQAHAGEGQAGERGQAGEAGHQGDEAEAVDERTPPIEALAAGFRPLAFEPPERHGEDREGQGYRDPEDAPPSEGVGQEAAQDGPGRKPDIDGRRVDADGPAALAGREHGGQDGHARAEDHGPADPLDGTEGDEGRPRRRQGGEDRAEAEDGDARGEDPLAPVDIGQAAEGDEEHGRGQHVGRRDPAQGHGAHRELLGDERHADVEAGSHERGQERGRGRDEQGRPLDRLVPFRHVPAIISRGGQISTY